MTVSGGVFKHRSSVVQVGDAERTVLLDLDDAAHPPRILTGPAATVWQAVDGTRDLSAICRWVADEFGTTPDQVSADVRTFLADLAADELLEHAEPVEPLEPLDELPSQDVSDD